MELDHGEWVISEKAQNEEEEFGVKIEMQGYLCWREVKKKKKRRQDESRHMKGTEYQAKAFGFYSERQSRDFGDLSKKMTQ